jgi:POT family proton-dependent oligopeptide transporter
MTVQRKGLEQLEGGGGGPEAEESFLNVRKYRQDELPSNVNTKEQLMKLPIEYLSENPARPLQHMVESSCTSSNNKLAIADAPENRQEEVHEYALNPLTYSVILILTVELLERFAFYGINYTQTSYLTGAYNKDWNSGMTSVEASSFVSISTAVAYTAPFIGALLADCVLGDYWVIILGMAFLYTPGLVLIQMTTIPHLFGPNFPTNLLSFGLLLLWPVGAGVIKSVVNIFGAKQYHPVLQSALIESYYVNFYMCINVGALVGGILVPLVAQHDIVTAYAIPVFMLAGGVCLFVSFSGRYVKRKPQGNLPQALGALRALFFRSTTNVNNAGRAPASEAFGGEERTGHEVPSIILMGAAYQAQQLRNVMIISALVVPFNVAYSQMATIFIVQGTVMQDALWGNIDAAMMNNCDAISVLICGVLVGTYFYPALAAQDIKIYTTYKFALGSLCGMLAIAWALVIEYYIHYKYAATGQKVSILWLSFSYFLIGAGEIFAISAAYEVAFAVAPKEQKALSSAINLFCIGGVPNLVCMTLFKLCAHWFTNADGNANIEDIRQYSEAKVYNYFWVLLGISFFGTAVNMLPSVRDWVADVEQQVVHRKAALAAMEEDEDAEPGEKRKLLDKKRMTSMTAPPSDEEESEGEPLVNSITRLRINPAAAGNGKPPARATPRPPIGTPNKVSLHVKRKERPQKKLAKQKREFVLLNRFGSQYGSTNA